MENELIIGRWYKWIWKVNGLLTYGKIEIVREKAFSVSEGFDRKYGKGDAYNFVSCKDLKLVTDFTEIKAFLPVNHPEHKSLAGRYLKALKHFPNHTDYTKNDYIKIEFDNLQGKVKCDRGFSFGHGNYDWEKSGVELVNEFPSEGCVYDDLKKLEPLVKYLLNRPLNNPDGKVSKTEAIGIGWNKISWWWLKTNKSEKPKFNLSDLKQFLPNNEIHKHVECIEFKLPEKWYVKATKENEEVLKNWRGANHTGWKDYLCITSDKYWDFTKSAYDRGFIEITYDQFQKYVLFTPSKLDNDECDECCGLGTVMVGKLYPNGHTEVNEECSYCKGTGHIVTYPLIPNESFPISKELTIPQLKKQKIEIDFNLNTSKIVPIQINLTKKPKKEIKLIKIENFNLKI